MKQKNKVIRLQKRIKDYESMKSKDGFHKPGSLRK